MFVASTWRRIGARLIDSFLTSFLFLPLAVPAFKAIMNREDFAFSYSWVAVCASLYFLYHWLFVQFLGGTVGKLVFGLRIVPAVDPTAELKWVQSFLRVLSDQLSIFFGVGLQSLMFLRLDRTHVSDWIAETRVVQKLERASQPERRVVLAIFFCMYFSATSFYTCYQTFQKLRFDKSAVIILRNFASVR